MNYPFVTSKGCDSETNAQYICRCRCRCFVLQVSVSLKNSLLHAQAHPKRTVPMIILAFQSSWHPSALDESVTTLKQMLNVYVDIDVLFCSFSYLQKTLHKNLSSANYYNNMLKYAICVFFFDFNTQELLSDVAQTSPNIFPCYRLHPSPFNIIAH